MISYEEIQELLAEQGVENVAVKEISELAEENKEPFHTINWFYGKSE